MDALPFTLRRELARVLGSKPTALIGCRATGLAYPCCEYDFLVLSDKPCGLRGMRIGGHHVDLLEIASDRSALSKNPEASLALLSSHLTTDRQSMLMSIILKSRRQGRARLQRMVLDAEIFQTLSKLSRCDESTSVEDNASASFWLLSASYSFGRAMSALLGRPLSRSHMVSELRAASSASGWRGFDVWAESAGLENASSTATSRRLEAFREATILPSRLSEEARQRLNAAKLGQLSSDIEYELAEARARYMAREHMVVELYSYLGLELVQAVEKLYIASCTLEGRSPQFSTVVSELKDLGSVLKIRPETFRLLGLERDVKVVSERAERLRKAAEQVVVELPKTYR